MDCFGRTGRDVLFAHRRYGDELFSLVEALTMRHELLMCRALFNPEDF